MPFLKDKSFLKMKTKHTVWKFQSFSATQILHEIYFGELTMSFLIGLVALKNYFGELLQILKD